MPEEINRAVEDLLSFGAPRALRTREMAPGFGFEFDGISAIEPLGSWSFCNLRRALTDSGGGPGRRHAFRELWLDAAGEHGEAGDGGSGGEYAGLG